MSPAQPWAPCTGPQGPAVIMSATLYAHKFPPPSEATLMEWSVSFYFGGWAGGAGHFGFSLGVPPRRERESPQREPPSERGGGVHTGGALLQLSVAVEPSGFCMPADRRTIPCLQTSPSAGPQSPSPAPTARCPTKPARCAPATLWPARCSRGTMTWPTTLWRCRTRLWWVSGLRFGWLWCLGVRGVRRGSGPVGLGVKSGPSPSTHAPCCLHTMPVAGRRHCKADRGQAPGVLRVDRAAQPAIYLLSGGCCRVQAAPPGWEAPAGRLCAEKSLNA